MAEARAPAGGVVGLVPTMGFLHEGHLSLMERSVAECDQTIATLYVNPLQFDDPADLDRYPADQDRDLALAEACGVDLMVVPGPQEMFASPPLTGVAVAGIGERLEGEFRPGHMAGVATVVTRLLAGLQPHRAYFGRKDAQQLAVITRLVQDLGFPVEVVGCALVRESDGLALSSRNVLLGERRAEALALSRGLMRAADRFDHGERRAKVLESAVRSAVPDGALEYARLCETSTMTRTAVAEGETVLVTAARFGQVRIIDNVGLIVGGSADRGVRLGHPSLIYGSEGT
jgi:pantoate--beta-alanine ligase